MKVFLENLQNFAFFPAHQREKKRGFGKFAGWIAGEKVAAGEAGERAAGEGEGPADGGKRKLRDRRSPVTQGGHGKGALHRRKSPGRKTRPKEKQRGHTVVCPLCRYRLEKISPKGCRSTRLA